MPKNESACAMAPNGAKLLVDETFEPATVSEASYRLKRLVAERDYRYSMLPEDDDIPDELCHAYSDEIRRIKEAAIYIEATDLRDVYRKAGIVLVSYSGDDEELNRELIESLMRNVAHINIDLGRTMRVNSGQQAA